MRADVAYFGTFGYELDATAFTAEEREAVRAQVAFMKRYRGLIQFGEFYRLRSPFAGRGNECAWMVVGEGAREAIVAYYRVLQEVNAGRRQVRLAGLDPEARYAVREQGVPGGRGGALTAAACRVRSSCASASTSRTSRAVRISRAAVTLSRGSLCSSACSSHSGTKGRGHGACQLARRKGKPCTGRC